MWISKTFGKNASRTEARFLKFVCKGTNKYANYQIICIFFAPAIIKNKKSIRQGAPF